MSTHDQALSRLEGAVAQHLKTPADAALAAEVLRIHGPEECKGGRHVLGRVECLLLPYALATVGLKGSKR